ncbi:MAG: peptide deformylase [Lachnospiraceae bacterium]|nr:peptide deformylase [Lachnospiraceae bacterium]
MAILNIRQLGDEVLTKKCKPVRLITPRIEQLVDDMFETMYETGGVGLAAPQVGILKRLVVIDCTPEPEPGEEPKEEDALRFVMINPVIRETEGEQTGYEGCLSYTGMSGVVTRPEKVTVEYTALDGERYTLTGEGLLARAICHECDHLDGIMYTQKVEGEIITNEELDRRIEEARKAQEEAQGEAQEEAKEN